MVGITARYSTAFELGDDRLLHVGGDYSRRWPDEAVRYAQQPESNVAPLFVDTGFLNASAVDTVLTEAAFLDGPFSVQGEYGLSTVRLHDGPRPTFHAFYVFGSYALTGERRQYRKTEESLVDSVRVVSSEMAREGWAPLRLLTGSRAST